MLDKIETLSLPLLDNLLRICAVLFCIMPLAYTFSVDWTSLYYSQTFETILGEYLCNIAVNLFGWTCGLVCFLSDRQYRYDAPNPLEQIRSMFGMRGYPAFIVVNLLRFLASAISFCPLVLFIYHAILRETVVGFHYDYDLIAKFIIAQIIANGISYTLTKVACLYDRYVKKNTAKSASAN